MTGPSAVRRLRVLTVNIHKGYTALRRRYVLNELRDAVRAVASDLVLLQEVQGPRAGLGSEQAEFLADTIWQDHAFARNAVVRGDGQGNAVLSRWPILRHSNHDVSQPGDEPRGLLHCVLDLSGLKLHAICVHLGLRESHRIGQLARLRDVVREVPAAAPLVIAGDFNDWRGKADRALTDALGVYEVFEEVKGRPARTFPSVLPVFRLDRIYARGLDVVDARVHYAFPSSRMSDHAALAATFEIPRK